MHRRFYYFILVFIVILLGLASRRFGGYLPVFVAEQAGDVLWAAMIYFGVRGIFPAKTRLFTFGLSLLFCFLIEFSQLYQAAWLNYIRHTVVGSLILGQGFLAVDLVRYTAGVILAFSFDLFLFKPTR